MDGAARELVLFFRERTLVWGLHPSRGAPLLLDAAEGGPSDLRVPGRVRSVRAPADERVLVLELLPGRGRGARDVVVELLGNQWNALVVERPDDRIRHVLVRRGDPRPLRVGGPYLPPPPSGREGVQAPLSLERWRALLDPVPPGDRRRVLVSGVAWTSSINAPALLDAIPEDPGLALDAGYALWVDLAFGDTAPNPGLLDGPRGLQPYPRPLPGMGWRATSTLLEAFRIWAEEEGPRPGEPGTAALLPPALLERLEQAVDGALRRVTSVEAELQALGDEEELRRRGDLLLARYHEVPPGASRVTLTDFEGRPLTLELDPTRSVQENASDLYDRAGRVARARSRLPSILARAGEAAEALASLLQRARRGEAGADELEVALPDLPVKAAGASGAESLPYRVFRSSGGLEIRVGRGARHNDDLTFHHAAPDDVWLHARHAAGAHVILRWSQPGNPPARDLREAAVLAALHSRARTSGSVPVDWTLRKYVRKPRGSAPGSVLPQRVKTLFVEPDPGMAERLAQGA
jgi:hypothetical protein